ncbi:porin, partial [Neisseria gonorrhoeae]
AKSRIRTKVSDFGSFIGFKGVGIWAAG